MIWLVLLTAVLGSFSGPGSKVLKLSSFNFAERVLQSRVSRRPAMPADSGP